MTSTRNPSPARAPGKDASPTLRDGFEVLDDCHRQTLQTLRKLETLITRLAVYGADPEARVLAAEVVEFFTTVAGAHHQDEELHVFPSLLASGDDDLVQTVQRLQQDHFWLAKDWQELAPQLDAVAAGQSWYELDTLREVAGVFGALSHDHVELEESCIYPQARARLGARERQEMGREMAARRHAGDRKAPPRS